MHGSRTPALAAALVLTSFLLACAAPVQLEETASAKWSRGWTDPGVALADAGEARRVPRAKGPQNVFLRVQGKARTFGLFDGQAFFQTTVDLWAPFDVEIRFGAYDPAKAPPDTGAYGCLEVSGEGATTNFSPAFDMCAEFLFGGLNLFSLQDGVRLPTTFSQSAGIVELRIEADGTDMNLYWRVAGDPTWILLNSVPFDASMQNVALKPSFGVTGLTKKQEVGFDRFDVTANSASPFPLSAAEAAVVDVHTALYSQLRAHYAMDGATPDAAGAQTLLAAAGAALADAIAKVEALPETKATKKAAKGLGKGLKKNDKALARLAQGKLTTSQKQLEKAGAQEVKAILLLVPQSIE